MTNKAVMGKVIELADYRGAADYLELQPDQNVQAIVYQEAGEYIVAFGQPPYLWRRHSALAEVRQTYFYFDWSEPPAGQELGRAILLIGEL